MAPSLIDWSEAVRWGQAYARVRPVPHLETIQIDRLHQLAHAQTRRIYPLVQAVSERLDHLPPPRIQVVSRGKVVEASVNSMRSVADPHAISLAQASRVPAVLRRRFWAHNLGLAAGMYAGNVLGQHELFIPPAHTSGRTWLVGPNITAVVQRVGPDHANDVIAGVLATQLVHRFLVEGVPWIRPYALAILDAYIREIDRSDKAFFKAVERLGAFLAQVEHTDGNGFGDTVSWVLTPRQKRAIHAGQAFFAAVEGYGALIANRVMQGAGIDAVSVGKALVGQYSGHHVILRFTHILPGMGIDYVTPGLGLQFIQQVVKTGGMELVNRLWNAPNSLPSLEELDTPQRWIDRITTA